MLDQSRTGEVTNSNNYGEMEHDKNRDPSIITAGPSGININLGVPPFDPDVSCVCCRQQDSPLLFNHPLLIGRMCSRCKRLEASRRRKGLRKYLRGYTRPVDNTIRALDKDALMENIFWLDDDGCFACCSICGNGYGQTQVVCSGNSCGRGYCDTCLTRLLDAADKEQIDAKEDWRCFLCCQESHGWINPRPDWQEGLIRLYEPSTRNTLPSPVMSQAWIRSKKTVGMRVLSLADNIGAGHVALNALDIKVAAYFTSEIRGKATEITQINHTIHCLGDLLKLDKNQIWSILPIDLVIAAPAVPKTEETEEKKKLEYLHKVYEILELLQRQNGQNNPLYWLIETPTYISTALRKDINSTFKVEPVLWNAQCFSPVLMPKLYWGNIPNLTSCLEFYREHGFKNNLSEYIYRHTIDKRVALFHKIEMQFGIPCAENLFDNILKRNTMSRSSFVWAKPLGVAPSMMWPVKVVKLPLVYCNCDNAWLMGFPVHYTDCSSGRGIRLFLLSNSMSVHLLRHLLTPLVEQIKA